MSETTELSETQDRAADRPQRRIDSRELLGESRRIVIDHDGEFYLLPRTRRGKLILTK